MKSIDIKSVIIGVLGTILVFISIGATGLNLGDIEVRSISIKNSYGKEVGWWGSSTNGFGFLETMDADGKQTVYLGTSEDGGGLLETKTNGNKTAYLGGGALKTYDTNGKEIVSLGLGKHGGGFLEIKNEHGAMVGYFGAGKDQDGMIILSDRYGDSGWGKSGKK